MSIKIIQDRLSQYDCRTQLDEENAIKEITQEIAFGIVGVIWQLRWA
jgi:hypothetical protein